ncbi:MAG TPA: CAP domain-containing protein [Streptosporangiaceae bacterium]|nr:CAP domain-containing protein [Streptosporangiaceae bacterium]
MPAGAPARHRAPRRGAPASYGPPPRRGPSRRARYLLCALLVLPMLAAAGVYLTCGPAPAPASATDKVTIPQVPPACDPLAAGSAGSCAGRPFHAAVASVPASLSPSAARAKHRHPRPAPSASAGSASASSASPPSATSATNPAGTSAGSAAAQVLALVNQARSAAGLPALTITAGLDASASAHNSKMAGGCGLSHQCPGEPDLGARETAAGVHWTAAGENIGEGGPVAASATAIAQMAVSLTQAMLNEKPPDDGHRLNILSRSFTHVGIAVYRDSSGTVWLTQDFSN